MQNDKITINQAIYSIVLFNFGSSVVMGINVGVGQDTLISIVLATLMAVPIFILYSRILKLFPQKNLFEISELLFGKIIGKGITILLIWYSLHLAALVLRNFAEFTEITAMPETPQLPILILLTLTTIYLARSGIRAIGKWSVIAFFIVLFVVFLTFVPSISNIKLENLFPFMQSPPSKIVKIGFQIFSFPLGETVLFLCIGSKLPGDKIKKIFLISLLLICFIFLIIFFRNLVLSGRRMTQINIFPSYVTARVTEISNFLARTESFISSNFLFAGIVKISVCLLAAANGLKSLFHLKDAKPMVLPAGLLAMALCTILYHSTMEMFDFINYYGYYAFPFQLVIPLIILIAGEFYVRKGKKTMVISS